MPSYAKIPYRGKHIQYTNKSCIKFVKDMIEKADLEVEHYHGRFFWAGPAVRVKSLQAALSYTKVPCQYDQMGLGYIVYPKTKDEGEIVE